LKAQQGDKSGPSFLASHPDPGNRAQNVSSILSRFPAKQYQSGDSPDFLAAKKALDKVGPQSVAEAQVAIPSFELRRLSVKELSAANFENYDHGAFRVPYPGNWQLIGNPNSSLTIYPKGGANSAAVCYGTIISGFTPNSRGKQLDDAMRQLINGIRDTNPGLRPAGNPVNISVGGRAAKSVEMLGTSAILQNGEPLAERIRLVALQGRGSLVLYMVFVAPDGDFDSMRPTFDRIMRSFTAR